MIALNTPKCLRLFSSAPHSSQMNLILWILLGAFTASVKGRTWEDRYKLVCQYDASSYFREGVGRFLLSNLDPQLCTHMIYSRLGISKTNEVYSRDPGLDLGPGEIEPNPPDDNPNNNEGDVDMIRKTVALRQENSGLKILISIGGSDQSSASWSDLVRQTANRKTFINSVKSWLVRYDLDGVELHWEFPGVGQGARPDEDKDNFIKLVSELRTSLVTGENGKTYLISAAFSCKKEVVAVAYNISTISRELDMLNLMCYDFKIYSTESKLIGHHSPLHPKSTDSESDKLLTVELSVNSFLELGAPKEKLILGITSYARTYAVNGKYQFGEEATGSGLPGQYTRKESLLAYYEICLELSQSNQWQMSFDYDYMVPYAYNQSRWIGYDDEISVGLKVDFAQSKGLGGVSVNSVDMDDCKNLCHGWFNCPLVSSVKQKMNGL